MVYKWSKRDAAPILSERYATVFKAEGDGRDVTNKLQQAIQQAKKEEKLLYVKYGSLGGDYLISEPINTEGVSIVCDLPQLITFHANPDTRLSNWQVGANPNDVGLFVSLEADDVFIEGLGIDMHDSYAAGIAFFGGKNLRARKNNVRNSSNCGIQFYGANGTKKNNGGLLRPVENAVMELNTVMKCRWNLVFDGEVYDSAVVNNFSKNALHRHVSVDVNEAGARKGSGLIVSKNRLEGMLAENEIPEKWIDTPSVDLGNHSAINFREAADVITEGNFVRNWYGLFALGINKGSGVFTSNRVVNDPGVQNMPAALELRDVTAPTLITNNVFSSHRDDKHTFGDNSGVVISNNIGIADSNVG